MKTISAVSLLFFSAAIAVNGQIISRNSDFEKNDPAAPKKAAHWIFYGKGYEISEDNINDDKNQNIHVTGDGKGSCGLYQVVYGKPGKKYQLSIDFLPVAIRAGKIIPFYITVVRKDGSTNFLVLKEFNQKTVKDPGKWQTLTAELDLTKYPDATGSFGIWSIGIGLDGDFFIDNYTCTELPDAQ